MAAPDVRLLTAPDELRRAADVVSQGMLAPIDDARLDETVERYLSSRVFGATSPASRICGTGRWFDTDVRVPGGQLEAAAVSGVAVLPTDRRQGHLRRLMGALLADAVDAGKPISVLIAAEWPIYARYGYGPATQACGWEVDARLAHFRRPAQGETELLTGDELRPLVDQIFEGFFDRTPGVLRRDARFWDWRCGLKPSPGEDSGLVRFALWRDPAGEPAGFVRYRVEERFTSNRPDSIADVELLIGTSHDADVELWRHVCELDWVQKVTLGPSSVDDAVPLELTDARAATCIDVSDNVWLRVLDVPAAFATRRSPVGGSSVVEVLDDAGYATGRWRVELCPDGGEAAGTSEPADLTMPASALGAAYLGGTPVERLARAGWLDEHTPGAVARLDTLLATHPAPWNPTGF